MYICICICMYIYIYVFTYTHIFLVFFPCQHVRFEHQLGYFREAVRRGSLDKATDVHRFLPAFVQRLVSKI